MAEVDREKLRHQVQFVRDTIRRLRDVEARGREAFLGDELVQAAAVRYLQIGIEALIDAANHIVAREGLGIPRSYRDAVRLLVENSTLPREKQPAFERMIAFRNRAVHLYDEIDPAEVFSIISTSLGDLEVFLEALVRRYFPGGELH